MKNKLTYKTYREWALLPLVLTTDQAAVLLQISRDQCSKLCRTGQLPSFKVGKLHRIRREDLKEYMEQQTNFERKTS